MGSLRFLTAGESHGQCLTAIVEGIPAGLRLDIDEMNRDMARRQQGYGRGGRMKIETDRVEILSGVRFGETMGDPITLRVTNRDWANWEERMAVFGEPAAVPVTAARPGHADLTGIKKYNRQDIRDILERASARETAARVAVGALAKQFLQACGIQVVSQVREIGGVTVQDDRICREDIGKGASELNCYDPEAEEAYIAENGLLAGDRSHEGKDSGRQGRGRYPGGRVRGPCTPCTAGAGKPYPVGSSAGCPAGRSDDVHPGHQGSGDRCRFRLCESAGQPGP